MKNFYSLLVITALLVSCKSDKKEEFTYASYGKTINDNDALTTDRMLVHYDAMKVGDTINAKMTGKILEVCPKKGCWMKLDMGNNKIVRVTFKDYGFFVPLDATGEVVINGEAFKNETSVADLKHYAEDAKKSPEEIAKITEPEVTMSFVADGVLLKK